MPRSTKDSNEKKETKKAVDTTKKKTTKKTTKSSVVKATDKEKSTKKTTKNTTTAKTKSSTKKSTTTKTRTRKSTKKENVVTSLEYYDLPYRYNQTIVKILSQTPNTLFIYWDISDKDRENFENNYGKDFFNITKPVLIIHNETKNYSFEVDINDFANSWYLKLSDTDCKYSIELGRKFLQNNTPSEDIYTSYTNDYIFISSSNKLITPNDHVLFNYSNTVQFRNVKTNYQFEKEIKNISFIKNNELYHIYSKEILEDLPFNKFTNPSSNFKK